MNTVLGRAPGADLDDFDPRPVAVRARKLRVTSENGRIESLAERLLRARRGDCIQMHGPAQRLPNFDIEQMRSVEPFVGMRSISSG